jgi:hypothetical protein
VFTVWLKTGPSGGQDSKAGTGGDNPALCAGWDWYGANGRAVALWTTATQEDTAGIGWNTGWTLITINVVVPSSVVADGFGGAYSSGTKVTPTGFYPWIGGDSIDSGNEWFSDTTVYINPTGS